MGKGSARPRCRPITAYQPKGELQSKDYLLEETCEWWKWPWMTSLISYWRGPPKNSMTLAPKLRQTQSPGHQVLGGAKARGRAGSLSALGSLLQISGAHSQLESHQQKRVGHIQNKSTAACWLAAQSVRLCLRQTRPRQEHFPLGKKKKPSSSAF